MSRPSRRDVLVVAGATAIVDAGSVRASSTSTGTPTDAQVAFHDDFEDGDLRSGPPWVRYQVEGDFEATVVERDGPDGGDHALAVRETMGSGSVGVVGWQRPLAGWNGPWTLSGLFYTAAVPLDAPFQGHRILLADDPSSKEHSVKVLLGFKDPDGNRRPFGVGGYLVDSVEHDHDPGWQEDTWYRYEVSHDGGGRYEGRLWLPGDSRPSSPDAVSVGRPPDDTPRVAGIQMNGGQRRDFEVHHAFITWSTGSGEPPSDQRPPTAVQRGPDGPGANAWLDGWYTLVAWLAGVPILGSLVLATLVALTDDDGEDAPGNDEA